MKTIRLSDGSHVKSSDVIKIQKAVSKEITLYFHGRLKPHHITTKSGPKDFATIADRKAETQYKRRLMRLVRGSITLGEESATGHENIRKLSARHPLWVIDPIDGTRRYKNDSNLFGSMIALVDKGEVVGAWIHFPASGKTIEAAKGAGAFMDGKRLRVKKPNPRNPNKINGVVDVEYWGDDGKRRKKPKLEFGTAKKTICSAFDYACMATRVPIDKKHAPKQTHYFSRRWPKDMKPWDHLPGIRIASEAGAFVRTWKGNRVNVNSITEGILVACDRRTWSRVRSMLSAIKPH